MLSKMKTEKLPVDFTSWWSSMISPKAVSVGWNGQGPDCSGLNSRSVSMMLWVCPGRRGRFGAIGGGSSAFLRDGKPLTNFSVSWSCFPKAYSNSFSP